MATNNGATPVADIGDNPIIQLGFVVRDAVKTAKRYAEIFGIGPWNLIDGEVRDCILCGKTLKNMDCCLRLAIADLGKMQIELIQPMYGPSTHMSFLEEKGEGIHHVSFGVIEGHDKIISGLMGRGIGIEMQGLAGDVDTFTYMSTQKALGTVFEVVNPILSNATLPSWGTLNQPDTSAVNIKGKEIKQVGIVVEDAEETAKNYWDLLGVGPWTLIDFKPPHFGKGTFHGVDLHDEVNVHIKAAIGQLGELQIELLQPVRGPSTHREFLKTKGQGIHHVSFDQIEDFDEMVSDFNRIGIETESSGLLGGSITFAYMATQKDLGTIFEAVKVDPDKENTITAYGTYPPSE